MKKLIIALVSFSPIVAFAQTISSAGNNPTSISDATSLAQRLTYLFNLAIDVLIAFAILWIIICVVMWLVKMGSEDQGKWRSQVLWGIVGLAVILCIWGLVHVLTSTFNTANNGLNANEIPTVPTITQ